MLDWLARTAMLVLAALATLALIGSLASVSDSPIGAAFPGQTAATTPTPESDALPRPADGLAGAAGSDAASGAEPADTVRTTAPDPARSERDREAARWLKALTYAVLALVAVAGVGVVALVRIGGHLARLADR